MTETVDPAPSVSVLVTVYNREKFLEECLASVIASSWTDFELVIVDDASTDGSFRIAEGFAARDPRVRLYRNEQNLGDYGNRRRAAELARAQYIKYVDSDDVLYSHSLALMTSAMQASPRAALGISHSRPEEERPYPWTLSPANAWRKEFLGDGCMGSGPSGAILRRDAFFEVGGFRNWGILNDTDLWYRLSARWPIVLLPPGLVWWRRHPGQEFTRDDASLIYLEKGFEMASEALASLESPLTLAERSAAESRARQRHARRLLALALRGGNPSKAWSLARAAGLSPAEVMSGFSPYR